MDAPANRISFWSAPGGKLVLTNKRLLFTNRSKTKVSNEYLLKDIIKTGRAWNLTFFGLLVLPVGLVGLLLRNGMRINLQSGKSQRFVVSKRGDWIEKIDQSRNNLIDI